MPKRPLIPRKYQAWLKKHRWAVLFIAIVLFTLFIAFKRGAWSDWVGFKGKTVWDWLELFGVPLTLAILGFILQQQQQKRAADEAKEEILQVYVDRLSTLLVDKNILAIAAKVYAPEEEQSPETTATLEEKELLAAAVDVVRARTLSILRRFESDGDRKASVIRFLIEAEVISKAKLNLSDADLSGANLRGANLSGANLRGANLGGANLRGASFVDANLSEASLSGANLIQAKFSGANLRIADFSGANLVFASFALTYLGHTNFSGASLASANFSGANLSGCELSGTNLGGTNLCRVDLSDTDLSDTNLFSANLRFANLSGTNLSGTNLNSVSWEKNATIWPDPIEVAKAKNIPEELKQQLGITEAPE